MAQVVRNVNNSIHRINRSPMDSVVCFANNYPLDSDLAVGYCYPPFEQPGPGGLRSTNYWWLLTVLREKVKERKRFAV